MIDRLKRLLFFLALPCALLLAPAWTQADEARAKPEAPPLPREYSLSTIGIDAGLPHPTVTTTLQTRDGYLWVGTQGGLARFDGARFTTFQPSNTPALPTGTVRCLFEDAAGDLWAGLENGVVRFHAGRFELIGLRDTIVTSIAQDGSGTLWFGTFGHGLQSWRQGEWQRQGPPLAEHLTVRCVESDSAGRLWVAFNQAGELYCRENGLFRRIDPGGRLRGFDPNVICEWPRGTIWIGGYSHGLVRLRGDEVERYDLEQGLAGSQVADLRPAHGGGLWVVTGGLQKITDPDRVLFESAGLKIEAEATAVEEDREGSVWLSTKSDGLVQLRPLSYRVISAKNGLPSTAVKSVAQDPAGNIWLAPQHGGLVKIDPAGAVTLSTAESLPNRDVSLVCAARDGTVWFASGNLFQRRDGRVTPFPAVHPVHGLYEDRRGALWIGAGQGVLRYENGTWTKVEVMPGRPILYACAFAEAPDGTMYIGSWNLGVFKVPADRGAAIDLSASLPTKTIRSMLVDAEGRLWVGTKGKGVALWQEGHWLNSPALSDALGGHVFSMAEDDAGQLWLGTAMGIMRAQKQDLADVSRGRRAMADIALSGVNSGFHVAASWPGGQPTVWKTAEGRLLFASVRGLLELDPRRLPGNSEPPPVRIEQVAFDQQPAGDAGQLIAPAGTRGVTLDYTALSYVHPQRVRFKYRLDGYDADWVDAGPQRSVTYRSLGAGNYVFRVKAQNNDGVWNERPAALAFSVAPFFWQTWWFRLATVAGFTVGIVSMVRYLSFRRLRLKVRELEQQAALQRERARIARDIHDDVGNRLTEISLLSGLAMRENPAPGKTGQYVQRISSRVREVTDSLDEIVWAVSPGNDTLSSVVHYIGEFAVEFLQAADIRCSVEVPERIPNRTIPAEIRHNLFLAVKEAFNNSVRHAHASAVRLRVTLAADALVMTIHDNGDGFVASSRAGADGLRNMSQRMDEIGGQFQIKSEPGHGTEISLTYPWRDPTPS
jgi:signal transduction histidine kinase/ligand-binding sensor domain-containing protein